MNGDNGDSGIDDWSSFDFGVARDKKLRHERLDLLSADRPKWIQLLAVGLVGGALVPILALALSAWIIHPAFCRDIDTASLCAGGSKVAFYVAAAIVGALSASFSIGRHWSRSVLIAIFSFASLAVLWPLVGATLWSAAFISTTFGGLFYLLFAKIAQLRSYKWSLICAAIAIAIIWLIVCL